MPGTEAVRGRKNTTLPYRLLSSLPNIFRWLAIIGNSTILAPDVIYTHMHTHTNTRTEYTWLICLHGKYTYKPYCGWLLFDARFLFNSRATTMVFLCMNMSEVWLPESLGCQYTT